MADKIIDYRGLIFRGTKGFVGWQWVRAAVDSFLQAAGPRYFLLSSRPGEHLSHGFLQQVQPFWLSEDAEGQQNPGAIGDAKAYVGQLVQEETIREMVEEHDLERLRALLLDFDWLQAKLAGTDVTALIADTDLLPADGDARRVGALHLSARVLAGDKVQLWSQMYGRLMGEESPAIQEMLEDWPEELWLRPLRSSLTGPGGTLLRTLEGHTDPVLAVAVYDGGPWAISASRDGTLKVWDLSKASLESGQELRTLKGHSLGVNAVAVYNGGRRAISASDDHTLKVWDLEAGAPLATFSGDSSLHTCVVAPDDRTVVAGDHGGQVHILRLEGVQ
jgi:WD40 repeat protein